MNRRLALLSSAGLGALVLAIRELPSEPATAASDAEVAIKNPPSTARALATRTSTAPRTRALPVDAIYAPHERIVRLQPGADAHALAGSLGLAVHATDHNRDTALLSGSAAALEALRGHPEVLGAYDNGVMKGAGRWSRGSSSSTSTEATGARADQWHLAGANAGPAPSGLSDVIVAVLDSGVAYRDWCGDAACGSGDAPTHKQAASLADTTIVAPADFVDGDELPLDEHQHGTHIASTIVGSGAIEGVASGASLMPVRVLDADNQGTEYALVQGIYHAIDNGADLINLSLSFRPGFVPSPLLLEALVAADDAGVLVFAATGNDSLGVTSWPAVSPKVVAVAASAPESNYGDLSNPWRYTGIAHLAPYANTSSAVDLVAPGGDLTADRTRDGHPDGILAETIALGDPSTTGYWFFEGTSQAAAIATGAAARVLAAGAEPDEVVWALQRPARPLRGEGPLAGVGGGYLDIDRAQDAATSGNDFLDLNDDVRVAVLPYLERGDDDRVRPAVRFTALDAGNWLGESVRVYATLSDGTDSRSVRCWTQYETGTCTAYGDWVTLGAPTGHAWTVQVDGVQYIQDVIARPTGVLFATDALEAVLTAASDDDQLPTEFALGVFWAEGEDDELGDLAAAFTFTSGGTGLATSPMGVIATPAAVLPGVLSDTDGFSDGTGLATSPLGVATLDLQATLATLGTGLATSPLGLTTITLDDIVDLDGTGLATSPLGFTTVSFQPTDLDIDGTGLATSPMGFVPAATLEFGGFSGTDQTSSMLVVDGTGLATSPLGFHAVDLFQPGGGGADLMGASFEGGVPIYDVDPLAESVLDGSMVGGVLTDGGFVVDGGRDGGAVLAGSTLAELATGTGTHAPVFYGPAVD